MPETEAAGLHASGVEGAVLPSLLAKPRRKWKDDAVNDGALKDSIKPHICLGRDI
jgi:hypothetical protein